MLRPSFEIHVMNALIVAMSSTGKLMKRSTACNAKVTDNSMEQLADAVNGFVRTVDLVLVIYLLSFFCRHRYRNKSVGAASNSWLIYHSSG